VRAPTISPSNSGSAGEHTLRILRAVEQKRIERSSSPSSTRARTASCRGGAVPLRSESGQLIGAHDFVRNERLGIMHASISFFRCARRSSAVGVASRADTSILAASWCWTRSSSRWPRSSRAPAPYPARAFSSHRARGAARHGPLRCVHRRIRAPGFKLALAISVRIIVVPIPEAIRFDFWKIEASSS